MRTLILIIVFFVWVNHHLVAQHLVLQSGVSLIMSASGRLVLHNSSLVNNGTILANTSSSVHVSGSSNSSVSGTNVATFGNFEINNSGHLQINQSIAIAGNLTFTSGRLITAVGKTVAFNAGSQYTGASNSSHIVGTASKVGMSDFLFPIGKSGFLRSIGLYNITAADTYTAEYHIANPSTIGAATSSLTVPLHTVSTSEYWIVQRTGASHANITASWSSTTSGSITSLSDLRVAQWDGTSWIDKGNTLTSGTIASGVINSNQFTSFGANLPITLASISSNNPLPIELLDFTLVREDDTVLAVWRTASEKDIQKCILQRSSDGKHFYDCCELAATGNSPQMQTYSQVISPSSKIEYYRVCMVYSNGNMQHSSIKSITATDLKNQSLSMYYFNNQLSIVSNNSQSNSLLLNVSSVQGIQFLEQSVLIDSYGIQKVALDLPVGIYVARLTDMSECRNIIFVIQ